MYKRQVQHTSKVLAQLDVLQSLAEVAVQNNYVKPTLYPQDENRLHFINLRHPVVEKASQQQSYVPNNLEMGSETELFIVTGPNMAGKSTYCRSVALAVIMAQIGSFVPAERAELALRDRVFARIGASDDLASGHSTYMVEMNEVANILNQASSGSLVILDEVGRGTSTYDGLSMAWAVSEYLIKNIHAKTLFATHYHELTQLEPVSYTHLDVYKRQRLNRFVMNGQIYARKGIFISMAIKRSLKDHGEETTVKFAFTGKETIFEVNDIINRTIAASIPTGATNETDELAERCV